MKRGLDIVLSIFLMILSLPLWAIISIMIRLDSKGPVIYRSTRVGQYERLITVYKFRTMKANNDKAGITVGESDPRITRAGRFLRGYKLDEIPQLINLLKGDMTLVGPRPDVPGYNEVYKRYNPRHFEMKPGLTSPSSHYFFREPELYVDVSNPREKYINHTIPKKAVLDRELMDYSIVDEFRVLSRTLKTLIKT